MLAAEQAAEQARTSKREASAAQADLRAVRAELDEAAAGAFCGVSFLD